jgi:hypothetical protein
MRLDHPWGLAALGAVAVLIALYLYDRRRRTIPVGTLFLWQQIVSPQHQRQRFLPDGLFFAQLAVVLAFVAAHVRPIADTPPGPDAGAALALVLDVSASMQTAEPDGPRFETVRKRALALVAESDASADVTVIAAGSRPAVALPWTNDRARVRAALEALTPLDTPTDLASAMELARGIAGARPATRMVVLTDLPPEASSLDPETRAHFDYVQVGRNDDNVAIAGITVTAPPFHGPRDATVTIDVHNHGRTTREVALEARVGGTPWARRMLAIAPRATEHVLLADPPVGGVVEVRLATDDALGVDDRAAAWIGAGAPLDLLLVTDSRALADAFGEIASALAGSRVEVTSPERFAAATPAGRRVALFDGVVPANVPLATNALYVAPPAGNDVCPSGGRRSGAVVVDWDGDHPALAGLDALQALAVAGASQLREADWGSPIVIATSSDAAFPLLVAGERHGRRTACLGAELGGPLAASDRVPLLLLTLATLRWLAEPFGPSAITVETGRPALAGAGPTSPITGGGLAIGGDPPVVMADRAGLFTVGPAGAERMVIANLFDERESDVGRSGPGEWPATVRATPAATTLAGRPLAPWLLGLALVLLVVEWLAWRRSQLVRAPRPGVSTGPLR